MIVITLQLFFFLAVLILAVHFTSSVLSDMSEEGAAASAIVITLVGLFVGGFYGSEVNLLTGAAIVACSPILASLCYLLSRDDRGEQWDSDAEWIALVPVTVTQDESGWFVCDGALRVPVPAYLDHLVSFGGPGKKNVRADHLNAIFA